MGARHWCGRSGAMSTTTIGAIILRDRWRCAYCLRKVRREALHLDHVTPRARGGRSVSSNLVVACADCNLRRGSGPVPRGARAEVKRRLALPLDRAQGRALGDELYPWGKARREESKRLSIAKRAAKWDDGMAGLGFPFGECA